MFKSVLIIIFVIVILFIARTVTQRTKKAVPKDVITSDDTVQCLHCQTYIPRDDAIFKAEKAFCSTEHLNDWNQRS